MLSRQERKNLNKEFYTALGRMMQGTFSETGKRINWTNYRTGIRGVYVRMEADKRGVSFNVDVDHKDEDIREMFWAQFVELKHVLAAEMGRELIWHERFQKEDYTEVSRIQCALPGGSLYDKSTWPVMLVFLKVSLISFDSFWASCFDIFKTLES